MGHEQDVRASYVLSSLAAAAAAPVQPCCSVTSSVDLPQQLTSLAGQGWYPELELFNSD